MKGLGYSQKKSKDGDGLYFYVSNFDGREDMLALR